MMRFISFALFLAAVNLQGQTPTRVTGTVVDSGSPVSNALVELQQLSDADCARLFTKKGTPSRKDIEKLQRCAVDLPEVHTDDKGTFSIEVKPGWYAVRVLWLMKAKPGTTLMQCEYGDWKVAFVPSRDVTGKYDGMAEGMPFEVQAGKDIGIDFTYSEPLGKKGKCA